MDDTNDLVNLPAATTDEPSTVTPAALRRKAIAALMRDHRKVIVGFCARLLGNASQAEDAAQRTFEQAYRDYDRPIRVSRLAWLHGIAKHRCLDLLRSQQREAKHVDGDPEAVDAATAPDTGPHGALERSRLLAALEACLGRLSSEVRATVLLRFQREASYAEMASTLDRREDALQMRIGRALTALRSCLEGKGWDHG